MVISLGIPQERSSEPESTLSTRKEPFTNNPSGSKYMNMDAIAKYVYEMGQLKRVKRSGWWVAGITDPESVAEHTCRTALLGYVLASLAGADPMKTATICLFHDTAEVRIGDLHRVARRYLDVGGGEEQAFSEQVERLPQEVAASLLALFHDYEERASLEGQLAHDADLLECLVQAREYQTVGYEAVQDWIDNCYAGLQTDSARQLAEACLRVEPAEWWQGLKKDHKKLPTPRTDVP
jgi:putative hydrolase of HD superfamily